MTTEQAQVTELPPTAEPEQVQVPEHPSAVEPAQGQFPDLPPTVAPKTGGPKAVGKPRLVHAVREQAQWQPVDLDTLLPADHAARTVWTFVEGLDLSPFTDEVRAVEGHVGRPAIDPAILLSLWLYAFSQGVVSARDLERLCREHIAYRWLCGGVSVNYHTLSDFRSEGEAIDALFAQTLGVLTKSGILNLKRVAQDGMRVRASAGSSSFHRKDSLDAHVQAAQEQIALLTEAAKHPQPDVTKRQQAARKRAAKEREERAKAALDLMPEAEKAIKRRKKKTEGDARVSSTDPEARIMRMADGGFRPAFNAQVASDTATGIILGVEVTNSGSDRAQLLPMLDQLEERFEKLPEEVLVDGGFTSKIAIEKAKELGITLYAPPQKPLTDDREVKTPRKDDSEAVAAWRTFMDTPEAKEIYKLRAAVAEWVNAQLRRFGLTKFVLRSVSKAKNVLLLAALCHNLFRVVAIERKRAALEEQAAAELKKRAALAEKAATAA